MQNVNNNTLCLQVQCSLLQNRQSKLSIFFLRSWQQAQALVLETAFLGASSVLRQLDGQNFTLWSSQWNRTSECQLQPQSTQFQLMGNQNVLPLASCHLLYLTNYSVEPAIVKMSAVSCMLFDIYPVCLIENWILQGKVLCALCLHQKIVGNVHKTLLFPILLLL